MPENWALLWKGAITLNSETVGGEIEKKKWAMLVSLAWQRKIFFRCYADECGTHYRCCEGIYSQSKPWHFPLLNQIFSVPKPTCDVVSALLETSPEVRTTAVPYYVQIWSFCNSSSYHVSKLAEQSCPKNTNLWITVKIGLNETITNSVPEIKTCSHL